MKTLSNHIKALAKIILARSTPKEIVEVMGFFQSLLDDDDNFTPYDTWKEQIDALTFSEKGLKKLESNPYTKEDYEKKFYKRDQHLPPSLLYCVSQYLSNRASMVFDAVDVAEDDDNQILKSLKEKYKKLRQKGNNEDWMPGKPIAWVSPYHHIMPHVPRPPYNEAKYAELKSSLKKILASIKSVYNDFNLTTEEEALLKDLHKH